MRKFLKRLQVEAQARQAIRRATYREFIALFEKLEETFNITDFNNPRQVVTLTELFDTSRKSAQSYQAKVSSMPFFDCFLVSGTYLVEQQHVRQLLTKLVKMLEVAVAKIP